MAVFTETFLRLRQDLDQCQENRQKLIQDIRANVRSLARQNGAQLLEQGETRRAEFTAMITDLRGKIKDHAMQTRQQLADLAADLRQGGAIFAKTQPTQPACKHASAKTQPTCKHASAKTHPTRKHAFAKTQPTRKHAGKNR